MTRVDILTPVYNTPIAWVRQAVDSVLRQTFTDWRLLIVNDGSREETSRQLEALVDAVADRRIVYLRRPNGGVSTARNAAIRASGSEYLAILDADDAWCDHKLEVEVAFLDAHSEYAHVHGNVVLLFEDGTRGATRSTVEGFNSLTQQELLIRTLRKNIVGHGLFRRRAAEDVGLYDESLRTVEDKDLIIRMLLRGHRFYHLDQTVYCYRVHPGSSTHNVDAQLGGRLRLIEKMDEVMKSDIQWASATWPDLKRDMTRSAWRQAAEGHLARADYSTAMHYSMPRYCGLSWQSVQLLVHAAGSAALQRAGTMTRLWSGR